MVQTFHLSEMVRSWSKPSILVKLCGHAIVYQTCIGEKLHNKQRHILLHIHIDTIYLKVDAQMCIKLDKVSRTDMGKTLYLPEEGETLLNSYINFISCSIVYFLVSVICLSSIVILYSLIIIHP